MLKTTEEMTSFINQNLLGHVLAGNKHPPSQMRGGKVGILQI